MKKKESESEKRENYKLDFLLTKVTFQLEQTISSFNEAKKTAHIHLGITTFLFTVILGVINEFKSDWYSLLFSLPVALTIVSFYKIIDTLYAVRLINGKKIAYYEESFGKNLLQLKRSEIADILEIIKDYNEKTSLKNKVIKAVGEINFISLILVIILVIIKVVLIIHEI